MSSPVKLGPFNLGVNTRLPDTELTIPKVGSFIRAGVNTDLSTTGVMKRRQGYTLALGGLDCHSLWSDDEHAYFVDGTTLYAMTGPAEAPVAVAVRTGLNPRARLSYAEVNGTVAYSDGMRLGKLAGSTETDFCVPMLDPEPNVSAGGIGSLPAGRYQVCFTYVAKDYQQSGSTMPVQLEVAAGQAIVIAGLPAAFPPGIAAVAVFMSSQNGDQLMQAIKLESPQTDLVIATVPSLGARCQTLLSKPMPAGSIVRHNNGRLLVAAGNTLHYSDPYAPALRQVNANYIPFPTAITVIESVRTGTYVATEDATYYFAGDIAAADPVKVLPYGAVPGTGGAMRDKLGCWWMSARGLVRADAAGGVKNVQEDHIAMNKAALGASLFREQNGIKQVVTSLFGTEPTGASAYSYMDAEIVRKGTVL